MFGWIIELIIWFWIDSWSRRTKIFATCIWFAFIAMMGILYLAFKYRLL